MDASQLLVRVRGDVEARLRAFLDGCLKRSGEIGPAAVTVARTVSEITMRGGKRLRAAFVAAGARAAGEAEPSAATICAGAAVEIFQTYLLVHDDWMDGDASRRGGPTAHVTLAKKWGEDLGGAGAVLAGDLASAWGRILLAQSGAPPDRLADAMSLWAQMEESVVLGQALDVADHDPPLAVLVAHKTTSYTVRGPLLIGAALGGGSRDLAAALDRYAVPVGAAFQLRDDLLGLIGDEAKTGKPVGSDLANGKHTPPILDALESADAEGLAAIRRAHGRADASEEERRSAIDSIVRCGAVSRAEERIGAMLADASSALVDASFDDGARAILVDLARIAALRST